MNAQKDDFEAIRLVAGDAHATLDVEAVLSAGTVVIPTNREENHTRKSIPDWLDVVMATDEGLNVARNRGIERASSDWIVLADDDITFPTRVTAALIDSMHEGHLVGLGDFWPMRYVIGRFMIFHRSLWEHVGGFDESRPHGGDTDFAIRCEKAGARVVRLPRRLIPHHDARSGFSKLQHIEWVSYLVRQHPRRAALPAAKLVAKNLGLLSPRESEYPDDWRSRTWIPPSADVDADQGGAGR
jgi:glycosyltransferase involved in cell wall biosynthesis